MGLCIQGFGFNSLDECKLDFMLTLEQYLEQMQVDKELSAVLISIIDTVKEIAVAVKFGELGKAGSENVFGEQQLALDVLSNDIFMNHMKKNPLVGLIASEELDGEEKLGDGQYAVCADPLDGSSLVDVNLAIGTVVGVYKTSSFIGVKGEQQLASLAAVYGPRTTFLITVRKGVAEFRMDRDGNFFMTKDNFKVGEGKMFAPGNLRACKFSKAYQDLVNYWCEQQYTLRYSGGMVPDVNQIILKGKGIFAYPGYSEEPHGKLRLLFECAPMALLMEQAYGAASDGQIRILEKRVDSIDQRTPIFIGSSEEVQRCQRYLF